ncbi:hypothetical protein DUNSADRAFT_6241 [Dunaliella salina]|uniref:Transcriptional regulator n=1 Tax=Dunaliella salina TaxID=3046 RepID=A0ABQ7GNN9_DUNSA|nr:hypothetical protein DUNSADRAFT_6241 [Dunaliella salina]|eukprot:KAF5836229.1 hypothetical protein DUNSADRAFT_6241 [Dunaliella salina]
MNLQECAKESGGNLCCLSVICDLCWLLCPQNAPDRMQETFADSRVYMGGFTAQNFFHMMHPYDLPGSVKVINGVHMGGVSAAVDKVATGKLPPNSFKFFSGAVVWEPKQLEREIKAGCWYTAACSRSLVLKPCLQLPTPLWREMLLLMGGKYFEVAQDAYEGDEISGE